MNADNLEKMLLRAENKLSSRQDFINNNQRKGLKNMYASQMMLQTRRTQEILPSIKSPFLKNMVSKMFSQKRLQQIQPIIRQSSVRQRPELRIQKSKSLRESIKMKMSGLPLLSQKVFKQAKTETKQFVTQHFLPMKIPKSYSESKNDVEFVDSGYIELKKSLEIIQDMKSKAKQKQKRSSRSNSEESQYKEQSSKIIQKKLKQLHQQQTYMNIHLKDSRNTSLPKKLSKQLKSPDFVVRHKLSKQMFDQQRQQIKSLRSVINTLKGLDLSKGMKVKKYVKFFPKVITIEN